MLLDVGIILVWLSLSDNRIFILLSIIIEAMR
jgi:hypothetical protein